MMESCSAATPSDKGQVELTETGPAKGDQRNEGCEQEEKGHARGSENSTSGFNQSHSTGGIHSNRPTDLRGRTHDMRLRFLEQENAHCKELLRNYSKDLKFVLAHLEILQDWIDKNFGVELINKDSSHCQPKVCGSDEIERVKLLIQKEERIDTSNLEQEHTVSAGIILEEDNETAEYPQVTLKEEMADDEGEFEEDNFLNLPEESDFLHSNRVLRSGPGRQKSIYWRYFRQIRNTDGVLLRNECKLCGENVSMQANRMKNHVTLRCSKAQEAQVQFLERRDGRENPSGKHTGKKRSKFWNYFDAKLENGKIVNKCKKCGEIVSPQASRLANHVLRRCVNNSNQMHTQCDLNETIFSTSEGEDQAISVETIVETDDADGRNEENEMTVGTNQNWVYQYFDSRVVNGKVIDNKCKKCERYVYPPTTRLVNHFKICNKSTVEDDSPSIDNLMEPNVEGNEEIPAKDKHLDLTTTNKCGRKKIRFWKYFITERDNGKVVLNKCKKCGQKVSPQASRLANHVLKRCGRVTEIPSLSNSEFHDDALPNVDSSKSTSQLENSLAEDGIPDEAQLNLSSPQPFELGRKSSGGRHKSNCWEYFNTKRSNGKIVSNVCKICGQRVSPMATRMKRHLIRHKSIDSIDPKSYQNDPLRIRVTPAITEARRILESDLRSHFRLQTVQIEDFPLENPNKTQIKEKHMSICNYCSTRVSFNSVNWLRDHLQKCQPSLAAKFIGLGKRVRKNVEQCPKCGKVISSGLAKHMLIHLGLKPHNCTQCQKSFRVKHQLKFHIQSVHKGMRFPRSDRYKRKTPEVTLQEPGGNVNF